MVCTSNSGAFIGFLVDFEHFQCVDLAENALFKSYGTICLLLPPPTPTDELSHNATNMLEVIMKLLISSLNQSIEPGTWYLVPCTLAHAAHVLKYAT